MRTIITLVVFLVIGFVGSRGYVRRATHRLPLSGLLASGTEFFILGILAGPHGFNLITFAVIRDLEPIIALTLGWIGLLFGIEMSWDHIRRISRDVFRFLLIDAAASLTIFSLLMFFIINAIWPGHIAESAMGALIFGITASVSSPMIIALVSHRLPARGPLTNTMKIAGALSALFPLLAFGILFTLINPGISLQGVGSGLLWWVFVNVVGIVLGFVMVLFTHERTSDDEMLLLITGTVFLIGGLCYFLQLSSLYTAMIMGLVVGNFARRRDQVFRELHVIEKTVFLAFLLIVGALVSLPSLGAIAVILSYVLLRLLLKYVVTGTAAVQRFPELRRHGRRTGLVLSGQGAMAMAIALDFDLASTGFTMFSPLTVVAFAVIINDIVGYAITRRVLIATGEASPGVVVERGGEET